MASLWCGTELLMTVPRTLLAKREYAGVSRRHITMLRALLTLLKLYWTKIHDPEEGW